MSVKKSDSYFISAGEHSGDLLGADLVLALKERLSRMTSFGIAGQAMITLRLLLTNVPCMRPWDSKYRQQFNVLTDGSILLSSIHAQRIIAAHFATPCQSMSWARSPQLRSARRPSGLPGLTENTALSDSR